MKKRLLSLFCAAALLAGLLPTTAFALDGDKAIMLGTSGISGFDTAKGGTGYDYIYFGSWTAQDTYTTSGPIKWRVLDDQTNTGENGLFLLSEELLGTGNYGGVYFQQSYHYDSSSGSYHKGSAPANGDHTDCLIANAWQGSDAQTWCATFYSSNFSTGEQGAVIATTKSDAAFTSSTHSFSFAASENILNGDKVFFLSAQEAENSEYGFTNDAARIANYGGSVGVWWLRSPFATRSAGVVYDSGGVDCYYVINVWAARPAFNLDLTSVLFTSAAVGGKIPAASSGGNQGGEAADAIFEIGDYDGSEWKLTLLDKSRNFAISNATINGSGDTVVFSYSSAQTGTNEYISVVIADNGEITYYGRILQLDGTTNGTNGTASFTLPAGVTLSDTTKLYIFNEQYNGGENDDTKLTDYASQLIEVNPAIDDTAPTLTAGNVSRDSATEATVKFISDEAGSYYYTVVESGVAEPSIDTTEAGISCDTTEQTISLTSLSGAGAKDIYIVAKDAVGNVSQQLKITIPAYIAPSYGISASPAALDFGSKTVDYTQAPTAQTVTLTNTGNQNVTVTLPASTNYTVTAGTGFTNGNAALSPGIKAQFTVQPKTGLAPGDYTDKLSITGAYGVRDDVELRFVVVRQSGGSSSGGSSTPSKTPSQQAADKIKAAKDGETVEITLKTGKTTLDKEVFEELAGRDVTLQISLPGGVMWTVNGEDIPADADLTDLDLGVTMDTDGIPASVFNAITGETGTVQLTLAHDGEFGFALTLTAPLGKANADLWANLYHYDEDAGKLVFQTAARIGADGTADLRFTHASEYAIVIDDRDHTPKAFPFADVRETDWFYDAVDFVFQNELMNGTSGTTFAPDGTMTRAMLVTILHRQAGEPVVNYAMPFDDVTEGTWYSEAVRWAASEGIVTGTSATTFAPDAPVTREQFAAILYRYAQQSGADVSIGEDTNILSYADALEISEYAIPAMQWACGAGVIEGSGANLNPQDSATRAEAATMLMRFVQTIA